MFPLLVDALREWVVTRYNIHFENERDVSQLQHQPEELLAQIAERVNRPSKDILEDFGSSWFEEVAPKRYSWQLELMGLSDLSKVKPQSLSSLAASTGAWRNAIETLGNTFSTLLPVSFWWSNLKQEIINGEECQSGTFHFREEGTQISVLPFIIGILRSMARFQKKTMEARILNKENDLDSPTVTTQELLVEWRDIANESITDEPTYPALTQSKSLPTLPTPWAPTSITHITNASASSPPALITSPLFISPSSPAFLPSGMTTSTVTTPPQTPTSTSTPAATTEETLWQDRKPTQYFGLEAEELADLFPFHMVLKGEDFRIVQLGTLLAESQPKLQGTEFLSQTISVSTITVYGKTTTFDPRVDTAAANKFQLTNVQFMSVTFKSGPSFRGKVQERRRKNAPPLYFFFAKPSISSPQSRARGGSQIVISDSASPVFVEISKSNSTSSVNFEVSSTSTVANSSLGISFPFHNGGVGKMGMIQGELVEELMVREAARSMFPASPPRRSCHLTRSRSTSGSRTKKSDRKRKNKKKHRTHSNDESSRSVLSTSPVGSSDLQKQLTELRNTYQAEVAERKSLEKQLTTARIKATAESRATSAFLAHMSHEIRTPLNGILGMSQLLLESNLDVRERDTAETIQTSGQQLLTIVNDILDFEKIQAGCLTLEFISFDLRKVMEESCEMLSFQSNSKFLETIIHFSKDLPRWVKGDPGRLRQILLNFLNNAIKFTEQGHIRVICDIAEGLREDETMVHLKITVEDTGIGIPEDRISRLFKSFSQVDTSITRKYGGTGLGLVISQQLVELMGGSEISVESQVGVGSSFTFVIPLRVDREKEAEEKPVLKSKVFLVIENNEILRKALIEDLLRFGVEIVTASTIQEAEEKKRKNKISIIFSSTDVTRTPTWLEWLSARSCTVVLLHSSFSREGGDSFANKPFISLAKPIKMRELEYTILSELGLLSEEAKQMISGRRRKSIKLSRKFSMGGYSVLLVDDNAVNLKVASRLLERLCIKPDCVCSGQEALECAKRKQYDVILMDLCMPGMNGYEATAELRNLEKSTLVPKACKVIAITADATTDDRSKCLTSGMDDFVSKPLTLEKLADVLDRTLFSDSDSPLPSGVEAELLERIPYSECM